jgi:iron complex transport system substrate-binding protein
VLVRGGQGAFVSGRGTAADAMVRLAGGENAAGAIEGSKALTAEAAVAAVPDVLLAPAAVLAHTGGVEGLLSLPGIAETPAGRARRVIVLDDLMLLGFGPRTGQGALELARKLREPPGGGAP